MEITYDSWCAGACLFPGTCTVIAEVNTAVFIGKNCDNCCESDCCEPETEPYEVIYAWMPSACECVGQ